MYLINKEIPADGDTVFWRPTNDVNVQVNPTLVGGGLLFYDSVGKIVSDTLLEDIESQKITEDGYEKIAGEWYEVVASTNAISIIFSSNDTPFKREIALSFIDGSYEIGPIVRVSQSPKSWNQEVR